jgi:hypothetical protein
MPYKSCSDITFDAARNEERCQCRPAALRAYKGMLKAGAAETEAVEAAYKIYRFHHPLDEIQTSRLTIERWIYAERAH